MRGGQPKLEVVGGGVKVLKMNGLKGFEDEWVEGVLIRGSQIFSPPLTELDILALTAW